ncbi:DUF3293 domain-containing protein [Lysobacter sp. N42]|uniref:DUF3293 domain-containing protein n=1 Tax=Lysobacter sp. N42 TaxID=2545719 RepID=UPI00105188F2|nr:DUF3293 domain-containing protein [Lysobacter sp. N42]TCZ87078.1 DUF3293 domain-containing protein [Lysobacter sp. N42]
MSNDGTPRHASQDDPVALARAFASAVYRAELGGDPVELRVGQPATEIERRLPASTYAFITAWNPDAERQPGQANARDDDALAARLEAAGVDFRRTWAQDAEGGHREAGWLVAGLSPERADALAREFEQAGILAWLAGEPVRLHMLMPRPGGAADLPHVDWLE